MYQRLTIRLFLFIFFIGWASEVKAQLNIRIIESTSANAGHNMQSVWSNVVTAMGHTASIHPQTFLDNNAFFGNTDILIVSSGVINIPANRRLIIEQFVQSGRSVYIQSEYDCNYGSNQTFAQIVTNLGGTFNWVGQVSGTLAPMQPLGSFANTNLLVPSLSYWWWGCNGNPGCHVAPILQFNNLFHGFYFCPPNPLHGRMITTNDQDWVNQSTSTALMQNIITHLINGSLCGSGGAGASVSLGPDTTLCPSASITIGQTIQGASAYSWNTGANTSTINVSQPGTYILSVTFNGCIYRDTINITQHILPPFSIGPDTTLCAGQSFNLTANVAGGTVYTWNTGFVGPTLTISQPGTYSVSTLVNGCPLSDTVVVLPGTALPVNLGPDQTVCSNSLPLVLNAGNLPVGAQVLWSTGGTTPSISVSQAGTYWVSASQSGCSGSDTIVVNVINAPQVNLGPDQSACFGTQITLNTGLPGLPHVWNTGSQTATLNVTQSGLYWVTVGTAQCNASDSIQVNFIPAPQPNLGPDVSVCSGQPVFFNAFVPGAVSFLWQDGSTGFALEAQTTGVYHVAVTNAIGCTGYDTVQVTIIPTPPSNFLSNLFLCNGSEAVLTVPVPVNSIQWSTGETTASIIVGSPGIYTVNLANGPCTGSAQATVTIGNLTFPELGAERLLCSDESLQLSVEDIPGENASFLWSTGSTSSSILVSEPGTYWVRKSSACGQLIDSVVVTTRGCLCTIFIPNAFTPNTDGLNEVFRPKYACVFSEYEFVIFDRWGQPIFRTNKPDRGWDGTIADDSPDEAPMGVYIYLINYVNKWGSTDYLQLKGRVSLIR
jgi:gliding motility-associated-like protein